MQRYYDITLKNKNTGSSISYWADSFSMTSYGILRIMSSECGDISVCVSLNEELSVLSVDCKDEFDEYIEFLEKNGGLKNE